MINSLRYLVSHGLAQAGYDSTITSPILNIFTMLDSELAVSNFQFSPELEAEFMKLDQAILLMNAEGIEDPDDLLEDLENLEEDDEEDEEDEDWDDDWEDDDDSEEDDEE